MSRTLSRASRTETIEREPDLGDVALVGLHELAYGIDKNGAATCHLVTFFCGADDAG